MEKRHENLGEIVGGIGTCFAETSKGGKVYIGSVLGRVMVQDIGKRLYRVKNIIQVENNRQRDTREAREARAQA